MKSYQVITIKNGKMVREIRKVGKKSFKQRMDSFFGLDKATPEKRFWFYGALMLAGLAWVVSFITTVWYYIDFTNK